MLSLEAIKRCGQVGIDPKVVLLLYEALKVAEPSPHTKHVSGQNLCMALREILMESCGPLGKAVLEYHGIRTTEDIGKLVFKLIEFDVLSKSDDDNISDFLNVFDIKEEFNTDRIVEQIKI